MTVVYMLEHSHEWEDGHDDIKFIGIFSTREKAEAALEHVRRQPGFRDFPDGFYIGECEVKSEQLGWPEGFVTVLPDGTVSD